MRQKESISAVSGLAVLAAIIFILIIGNFPDERNVSVSFPDKNISITAEVAGNPALRERGLMFRNSLAENEGMLFIFGQPQELRFWMKNTLIPLDIIFVSENLTIVNIAESAQPCASGPCPLYLSAAPAKYAIEVNTGFAEKNGIKEGDIVTIE